MNKPVRLMYILLVLPFAGLAGTAEQSLVTGKADREAQLRILAVNGQAVKGSAVWLTPGTHKLAVSCIKTECYGARSVDAVLVLTAKPECDYELSAVFEGKHTKVAVKALWKKRKTP